MAAIWKGSLTLGLLNVPVELRPAVRPDHISFRLLDTHTHKPIKYERVRAGSGKAVPWEEIVKGYEYSKNKFVILTDEDFKAAALEQTNVIDIQDFVEQDQIEPRYFDTPYFLVPGKGAGKTYAVLREAMRAMQCVGIGSIILRTKEHLAGVHVVGDALVLDLMRFASQVVPQDEYSFPGKSGVRPAELTMAKQLLANLKTEFTPRKYVNVYQTNLLKLIKSKSKGKTAKFKSSPETGDPKVLDLMARLQASLGESEGRSGKARPKLKPATTKIKTKKPVRRHSA